MSFLFSFTLMPITYWGVSFGAVQPGLIDPRYEWSNIID